MPLISFVLPIYNEEKNIPRLWDELQIVEKQINAFKPKYTIPFASYVYFSHAENAFMNGEVNKPATACNTIEKASSIPVLLYPGDIWDYNSTWDNKINLEKFDSLYKEIPNRNFRTPLKSFSEVELILESKKYIERLKEKNAWYLVRLAKYTPFMGFFKVVNIYLFDLDVVMNFNIDRGLTKSLDNKKYDIKMHSESLNYIFKFDFGYETLTVNGRFEADFDGLKKMTKVFGIGPLNNMGKYIGLNLLFKDNIIIEFFKIIFRTKKMLKPQAV